MTQPGATSETLYALLMGRLARSRPLEGLPLSELDLAVDPAEGITDQPHIAGALGTLRLAARAQITGNDRILDLCCGIGGTARLLVTVYGCEVCGVDASYDRIREAEQLSRLVDMERLTWFKAADFLTASFGAIFSMVWARSHWTHFAEPGTLAAVAASALRPGGKLAFEDLLLMRPPETDSEHRWMQDLIAARRCSLTGVESWCQALEARGLGITLFEYDNPMLLQHCKAATALAAAIPQRYPADEITGWSCAQSLVSAGVINYGRFVARLNSQTEAPESEAVPE